MKRILILFLFFGISFSGYSQTKMNINKASGKRDSLSLSGNMVSVTGGTFNARTTPVTISSFRIEKYEVTYELWTAVKTWGMTHGYPDLAAGQHGSNPVGSNNPVTMVDWYDVVKWCNARSEKDGLTPVYYASTSFVTANVYKAGEPTIDNTMVLWTANGYRLPTEAEWEFAAKGGTLAQPTPNTYSGSNTIDNVAWYSTNSSGSTHAVGQKSANELGIYDMSGNVWEWCWEWYGTTYPVGGTTDPKGPSSGTHRVLRGGSFDTNDKGCRAGGRGSYTPNSSVNLNGFRCVQD